jgi:hypothetical protein
MYACIEINQCPRPRKTDDDWNRVFLWFPVQGQGVIKPIACRPVVSSANTTPILGNRCLNSSSSSSQSATNNQQQQQQQPVTSSSGGCNNATTNNNNINNNNAGRHSWGLYNSTSDLRCSALSAGQQTPLAAAPARGQPHLQRFSWSKGPHVEPSEMGTLCARPAAAAAQQTAAPPSSAQRKSLDATHGGRPSDSSNLPPAIQHQNKAAAGSITSINSISSATAGQTVGPSGRVADLSRRFGGSLSSVAAPPNSPTQIRQPPAYRPPPSSSRSSGELVFLFITND